MLLSVMFAPPMALASQSKSSTPKASLFSISLGNLNYRASQALLRLRNSCANSQYTINQRQQCRASSRKEATWCQPNSQMGHGIVPKFDELRLSKRKPKSHSLTTVIRILWRLQIFDHWTHASALFLARRMTHDSGTPSFLGITILNW